VSTGRRWTRLTVALLSVGALTLSACGSTADGAGESQSSSQQTGSASSASSAEGSSSAQSGSSESSAEQGSQEQSSSAAPQEMLKLTVGRLPCAADCGFLRMSDVKGFYQQYGVDVQFKEFNSAAQIFPALGSGEVDAIEQSPGALFVAAATGEGLSSKVVGSSMEGLPYAIYAKKGINSLKDLEGKTVAISSKTGLPAQVADLMLKKAGVDLSKVKWVNGGGNADRYKAVVAGVADAASSPADYVPNTDKDGIQALALSPDMIPDMLRYTILARNDVLESNGEAVTRYLAGLMAGLRYAYAHPDEAKQISADALKTTPDAPEVTYMYDMITKYKLVDPNAGVPMQKMNYLNDALVEVGLIDKPVDINKFIDLSFQEAAVKLVDGK